jgi:hypothetical protein
MRVGGNLEPFSMRTPSVCKARIDDKPADPDSGSGRDLINVMDLQRQ